MPLIQTLSRACRRIACGLLCLGVTLATPAAWAQTDADEALKEALRGRDAPAVYQALADGAAANPDAFLQPLYIAAIWGDTDVITALLDAGAEIDAVDRRNRSAMVAAVLKGNLDATRLLLSRGAQVDLPESTPGRNALMLVIDEAPSLEAMEVLLEFGADINFADLRGETPLAAAAFMGRPDAVDFLLQKGADVSVRNLQGVSPLSWAKQQGHDDIVATLRAAGMTE